MPTGGSQILERLGPEGLTRVLHDVLDHARLARLATACGLSYPGMRTRSQKRERLVRDLVRKAESESKARTAIVRALKKETSAASRIWARTTDEERERQLGDADYLHSNGKFGLHLFLLAAGSWAEADQSQFRSLAERKDLLPGTAAPEDGDADEIKQLRREITRLKKAHTRAQNKLQHVETQVNRLRDAEKSLKKDLVQRKGELAEARMLSERLRRELQTARRELEAGRAAAKSSPSQVEDVAKAVKRLASEQRKLTHALQKSLDAPAPKVRLEPEVLAPIVDGLEDLRKESGAVRRDRKKDARHAERQVEELRNEINSLRSMVAPAPPAGQKRTKAKERVGVFIDVQNMYYAARRLKGKLDFDALLEAAVRGRRLIQATAYVVESKEIDQSGFFAHLQQRAILLRRKTLKVRSDGSMKGDWDMEMALDILDAAPNLDVIILVSGDGDFSSLVRRVKSIGPRVEVVGFPRNTAKELLESADSFQPLDRKFMIREPAKKTDGGGG